MDKQYIKLWDIHTHIIPGIDDGSDSMDTTWSMVYSMYEKGVRGIFATPHSDDYLQNPQNAHAHYEQMLKRLGESFPELEIRFGCEINCDTGKMEETLRVLETGQLPTMNDSRFILVEFNSWLTPEEILGCTDQILNRGYIPIIAHVERYRLMMGNTEAISSLRDMGCKIQLNLYSLEEYGPRDIRDWSRQLVQLQLVNYLATDSHNPYTRPPSITGGMEYLQSNCPADYLKQITWQNAQDDLA